MNSDRTWKSCRCPIYASRTLAGKFKRKNTECNTWDEAKPLAKNCEHAGTWDAPAEPALPTQPPALPDAAEARVTLERPISAFEQYVDGNVHTNNCENFWSLL